MADSGLRLKKRKKKNLKKKTKKERSQKPPGLVQRRSTKKPPPQTLSLCGVGFPRSKGSSNTGAQVNHQVSGFHFAQRLGRSGCQRGGK